MTKASYSEADDMKTSYSAAEIAFLREQLEALIEVRNAGHYSDIVSVARAGLQKARRLRRRLSTDDAGHIDAVVSNYKQLVKSLLH